MKKLLVPFLLVALLQACAARPDSIPASFVSHENYVGQNCRQLSLALSDATKKLNDSSDKQHTKANVDAASVFFTLIPASKLLGDNAADVAKCKGEIEAIKTALVKAGCNKGGAILN